MKSIKSHENISMNFSWKLTCMFKNLSLLYFPLILQLEGITFSINITCYIYVLFIF